MTSPPSTSHTHAVFTKLDVEPSATQLIAASCQMFMVHAGWMESLVHVAKAEETAHKDESGNVIEKCKLELDFERHWPSEMRHFPLVDGREATVAEKKMWLPDPRRRDLFRNMIFIDHSIVSHTIVELSMMLKGC